MVFNFKHASIDDSIFKHVTNDVFDKVAFYYVGLFIIFLSYTLVQQINFDIQIIKI